MSDVNTSVSSTVESSSPVLAVSSSSSAAVPVPKEKKSRIVKRKDPTPAESVPAIAVAASTDPSSTDTSSADTSSSGNSSVSVSSDPVPTVGKKRAKSASKKAEKQKRVIGPAASNVLQLWRDVCKETSGKTQVIRRSHPKYEETKALFKQRFPLVSVPASASATVEEKEDGQIE